MKTRAPLYLDHAAATPLDHDVQKAMEVYWSTLFHNPSSVSLGSRTVREDVLEARKKVSRVLRCRPHEMIFTSGGTEANNLAIFGVAGMHTTPKHLITSSVEHPSVLFPIEELRKRGWSVTVLSVDHAGRVNVKDVQKAVRKTTALVSIIYANNEVGTVQPIQEIVEVVKEKNPKALVHTDACQATGALSLNVQRLGVDLLTINGSKCYGPKGSGALFVKAGMCIRPLFYGGGQEKGWRSGTENVPAIIGFGEAVTKAERMRSEESKRLANIRDAIFRNIQSAISSVVLNGPEKGRLSNNLHLSFPGISGEELVIYLEKNGVIASTGAACTTASVEPSHVLRAMGLKKEMIESSVRLTLGRSTTKQQVDQIVKAVVQSVREIEDVISKL